MPKAGRPRLPDGERRRELQTTVDPKTLDWLEAAALRHKLSVGRVLDAMIERLESLKEL
jgi:hypothetical protein